MIHDVESSRIAGLKFLLPVMLIFWCFSAGAQPSCWHTVPLPHEIVLEEDQAPFRLLSSTPVLYEGEGEDMLRNAAFLAGYIEEMFGFTPRIEAVSASSGQGSRKTSGDVAVQSPAILLRTDVEVKLPQEGYVIEASSDGVVVTAADPAGIFYGIQTLRKALYAASASEVDYACLPAAVVKDAPEFSYRGAHFDVSRHFFTVDQVKEYIDMMALHNMNRLHWHLTDDQGWRVEIDRYPKLTSVGSMREETLVGHLNDRPQVYDGKPYGGFYTKDQIRDIVRYAAERYVTIVPEIDLPGHMQAALAAYPELGCTGGPYKVWTKWGVSDDVLCAGKPEVLEFLDNVFLEIMDLFPSEYIHIGGDECPKTRWEACPLCQKKAAELGLTDDPSSTKEQKLQSYVMKHVAAFLNGYGRKVIGWDEILEGDAADGATVMSWRGESGGIRAARLGHDVVMTPNSYMYFDFCQGKDASREPLSIGGYIPVESVYMYSPVPKALKGKDRRHIIGVQANLWTEYITDFAHAQYMVLPRWAALAENQWNPSQDKDYKAFLDRLQYLVGLYGLLGYNYAGHVFGVEASFAPDYRKGAVMATLETMGQCPLRYTFDGSLPDTSSALYDGPVEIRRNAVLTAAAFRDGKAGEPVREEISFSLATARPVTLSAAPSERYTFDGAVMLTDGLKGGDVYGSGRWIGFEGIPMEAVIDLGEPKEISSVSLGVCVNTADGVFDARRIEVYVSDNGRRYTEVASEDYPAIASETRGVRRHFISFIPVKARYLKVRAEAEQSIPSWSWLSGSRAFLFVDEIEAGAALRADVPQVRYTGRVLRTEDGSVSYDWSGTYLTTVLKGERLDARIASEGECWFNVIVDGKPAGKFSIADTDTVVTLFPCSGDALCVRDVPCSSGEAQCEGCAPCGSRAGGSHTIMLQKRTEGEYGRATVKGFILPSGSTLSAEENIPSRHIEFIGNSLTCGYGTEGLDRDEPFKLSTENCNLTYATIIARYFDADYTLVSHSGQGAVRNYGDSLTVSSINMGDRMMRLFDADTVLVDKDSLHIPDLVVINLGTNDFSLPPFPSEEEFTEGYCRILEQIASLYGDVPVLCVCPPTTGDPLDRYLNAAKEKMGKDNIYVIILTKGLYNTTTDLGSSWHPNYSGQRKMAMGLIPYISTITGWEMPAGRCIR